MKLVTKLTAVFDRVLDALVLLVGISIILMMLAVSSDVVGRYFLKRPIAGVMEFSEFLLLYIVFLGAAWLLREEGHVKVDLVLNRLRPGTQVLLNIITSSMAAIVCLVLVWYGVMATLDYYQRDMVSMTFLEIPLYPVLAVIPVGSLLLFIQSLRRAYGYWASWRA